MEVPPTHRPRANGYNYCVDAEAVYVAAGQRLLRFDLNDGKRLSE